MIRTIAGGVLALLYIVMAVLQYNDPDGASWTALYAMAAVASGSIAVQGRAFDGVRRGIAFGVFGVALVWVAMLLPDATGEGIALDHEMSREVGGLAIVVVGVGVLGVLGPGKRVKRPKPKKSEPPEAGGASGG
jgi:hypothetical protein